MLVEGQTVEVSAHCASAKNWYKEKGYNPDGYKPFLVKCEDLQPSSKIKMRVICDYCGMEYITSNKSRNVGKRIVDKDACKSCCYIKRGESYRPKPDINGWKRIKAICEEHGYKLITSESEYGGHSSKIKYECPSHGIQLPNAGNFLRGSICKKCAVEAVTQGNRKSSEEVKSAIESVNGNKLLNPEDYKGVFCRNLRILCSCGKEYCTSFRNYTKHNVTRCPDCSRSVSYHEKEISDHLRSKGISFVKEKTFDGCVDKGKLFFDFYVPTYNLCIEYDGEQHFNDYFYRNRIDNPEAALLETQRRDLIKNLFCKKHNINLLRIPYWERRNIQSIIDKAITQIIAEDIV